MKTTVLAVCAFGLFSGCDLTSSQLNADGSEVAQSPEIRPTTNSTPNPSVFSPEPASTEVKSTPVVQAPTPPPDLPPPVQEVVRLAQTTLGDGVLLGYVENLKTPYSLSADQIIYLNDLGISEPVIQSLVKHSSGTSAGPDSPATPSISKPNSMAVSQPAPSKPAAPATQAGQGIFQNDQPSPSSAPGLSSPTGAPSVQYDVVPPTNYVAQAPQPTASEQMFYDSLAPYGAWVTDPDYGVVWQPTVAVVNPGWQPYCDSGYWVWTDCGWYWNSSYSWGWAPFHYGRWCRASRHGWCWVPDSVWGPAWVTWRTCDTHCGWAPLPPHCVWSPTLGFTYYGRGVTAGFGFGLSYDSYVYLGWGHFCDRRPWHYRASRTEVVSLHAQSRVINDVRGGGHGGVNIHGNNNTVIINHGPGITPVQSHTRTEIPRVTVADVGTPRSPVNSGHLGATPGVVGAYRPVTGSGNPPSAIPVSHSPSGPIHSAPAPSAPIRPYVGATVPKPELVGPSRVPPGTPSVAPSPSHAPVHSGPSLSNPSGLPNTAGTSAGTSVSRGDIVAHPRTTPPSSVPGYTGPPRTVPRPTPIAGISESSAPTPANGVGPHADIAASAPPVHTVGSNPNGGAGIFRENSGPVGAPGYPGAAAAPANNPVGPQSYRPAVAPQPIVSGYRYNPAGNNNAPVARYNPGPVAPVHSGASGYSNPGGAAAPASHGASSGSGTAPAAHGSKNGR